MTPQLPKPADVVSDLKGAVSFSTRLPLRPAAPMSGSDVARAVWALPVAGALVGLVGAVIYVIAYRLGAPPLAAAALTLAATVVATGGLHEDGLADVADGFGGGNTRERKLEIMDDSRIGTYGTCALVLSLLVRAGAIASLAQPELVVPALFAAHVGSRAILPAFMWFVSPARSEGLSAGAGRPTDMAVIIAAVLGILALFVALGPGRGFGALVAVLVVALALGWLTRRQIGGQTGDVLGGLEQVSEMAILLVAARI